MIKANIRDGATWKMLLASVALAVLTSTMRIMFIVCTMKSN